MPRQRSVSISGVLIGGIALVAAGCARGVWDQTTDRYAVALSLSPPVQVGEEDVTVKITPRESQAAGDLQVRFHYYPFVDRVKDSLASPEEVARVTPARRDAGGYHAILKLDRPGPWKIAVRIGQAERPDEIVYFTVDAQERPASGR